MKNKNLSDLQIAEIEEWDGKNVLLIYPNGSAGAKAFKTVADEEYDSNEYWCAMKKLDDLKVPRIDNSCDEVYSIVGRIMWLHNKLKDYDYFKTIADALSRTFHYGEMVIETPNERLICYLLNELGLFPTTEKEIFSRPSYEDLLIESRNYEIGKPKGKTNEEMYNFYYQQHINDGGNDKMHDAYALQYLVEHCLKNNNYTHLSQVKYDDDNNPIVGEFDIICSTYNDPVFGVLRIEDSENVLVYSTPEGLKAISI